MDLLKLLSSFKERRLLVIGDVMLDEYFNGEITRISPEAPVPIVKVHSHSASLGGAANVAANIVSLGGKARLLGVVGDDAAAHRIRNLCSSSGIEADLIADSPRPTTVKSRILANGKQLLRFDREDPTQISAALQEEFRRKAALILKDADALVVSDYNKGVIAPGLARSLIEVAAAPKKRVMIDSKNYVAYGMRNAALLKPNLRELHRETGIDTSTDAGVEKAAAAMMGKLHPGALLVTRGELGMSVFQGKARNDIPGIPAAAADVSGAGDTVLAAVSLGLAGGNGILESATLANYAASIVVRKAGTAAPSVQELHELISKSPGRSSK